LLPPALIAARLKFDSLAAKWLPKTYDRPHGNPQCLLPLTMSNSGIRKAWEAVRAAADVPWLRIHDLRHTAITRMAEASVPIPVILSMAGHISTRMQQHYTAISEFAKRRAVQAAFSAGNYMISGGRLVGEQQQVAIHRHRRESRGPSKRKSPQFSRGKSGSADSLIPPD
jgi:hypothetical protein